MVDMQLLVEVCRNPYKLVFPFLIMKKTKISDIVNNNAKFLSQKIKKDFFGDAPAPFIGRHGYPNINVGIMSAVDSDEKNLDSPKQWIKDKKSVQDIVGIRSSLINSRFKANAQTKSSMVEVAKEVGLASKPAEVEINLKEKPKFSFNTYSHSMPSGPNAELQKATITANTKVSSKERLYNQTTHCQEDRFHQWRRVRQPIKEGSSD